MTVLRLLVVGGLLTATCLGEPATPSADVIPSMLAKARTLESVPFREVVQAATGHTVHPFSQESFPDARARLPAILDAVLADLNRPDHPIHGAPRINEASKYIEDSLLERLNAIPGWACTFPSTAAGRQQRSGYPDLRIETPEGVFFLDPKLVASGSEQSSLRTFYYEPKIDTNKINEPGAHLLIGVSHGGWKDGKLRLIGWRLVDVADLPVRVKAEFQASNRELYAPDLTIAESAPSPSE